MRVSENRLRVLSLFVILGALILVTKLYFVQIVSGERFRLKAEHQYVAGINYFDRGSIFFSTKDGTLIPGASVENGYLLSINPNLLRENNNLDEVYATLSSLIEIDKETFIKKASRPDDTYEELRRRIPTDKAKEIRALKIPGVSVWSERWRTYPGNTMAAHSVGLIAYKGDELAGRYGLERQYEDVLKREGDDAFVNFFAEMFSNIQKTITSSDKLEGDIVTTIEPSVQAFLEKQILEVNKNYGSEFTGGMVIDPNNGEIIAMAIDPTFNPGKLDEVENVSMLSNKFVEDRYEMGSIIKPLTIAAGIDAGAITARTTYNDPGCMTLNSKIFCNYDGRSHGTSVSMQQVLNQSLNTGVAFAVQKMGGKTFAEYMLRFGLDEKTGIDLPNEGVSLVSNLKVKRDLELAQASFGQGVALTPITTVRALSALANGGTLITPHLVKEVRHKLGTYRSINYPDKDSRPRVISEATSEEISRMLTEVVDRSLRNGNVRLENYSVAAKTGTAQIAKEGGGGYYTDRNLHSFFGYFPSYDAQFLVFLYTYYPKGVQYASETLVDGFINTTKFLINYYNIPPDREAPPQARI